LWRLTAASSGVLVALSLNVGAASASSPGGHRPERNVNAVQVAKQVAHTEQNAESNAKSVQFLPVNANVPVQILSLGSNGGKTTQSNSSTAKSSASNQAWTDQSVGQVQVIPTDAPKDHGPSSQDGWKDHGPKGHDPKDNCPKDHDGWKDHGPKGHDGWLPGGHDGPDGNGHGP